MDFDFRYITIKGETYYLPHYVKAFALAFGIIAMLTAPLVLAAIAVWMLW